MIKSVPLIKMSSTSLSLQPTARSKTIRMRSTWRTTNKSNFYGLKGNSEKGHHSNKLNALFSG